MGLVFHVRVHVCKKRVETLNLDFSVFHSLARDFLMHNE